MYFPGANNTSSASIPLALKFFELIAGYLPGGNISTKCLTFMDGIPNANELAIPLYLVNDAKEFFITPFVRNCLNRFPCVLTMPRYKGAFTVIGNIFIRRNNDWAFIGDFPDFMFA
jgi:hypothetical protein